MTSDGQHSPKRELEPALVPELLVTDVEKSLAFWRDLCGFTVKYARPDEGFAYVVHGSAHVMLEQAGLGRNWLTGPLEKPLGRGINFQIEVDDIDPVVTALTAARIDLFMAPETKSYQVGSAELGVRQFLVTDPDGYLLRFQSPIGPR